MTDIEAFQDQWRQRRRALDESRSGLSRWAAQISRGLAGVIC